MIRILLIASLALMLSGCFKTVPVKRNFPAVPAELQQACADLEKTPDSTQLSDVVKTVTKNYSLYHECRTRNEAWIEWYDAQKKIFEEVK
jgi:hypothetical protein